MVWNKYKTTYLLGTLHWELLGIVCMKRYPQVHDIPTKIVIQAKTTIKEFDIPRCDLWNPENWGQEHGQYRLIDYGINHHISTLYKTK